MAPLPDSVQEIADIIGRDHALTLSGKARHRKLYVPKRYKDGHWIPESIGQEAADRLQRTFGGCKLSLASCFHLKTLQRRAAVQRDFVQGVKLPELMRRHGMSARGIQYAVSSKSVMDYA